MIVARQETILTSKTRRKSIGGSETIHCTELHTSEVTAAVLHCVGHPVASRSIYVGILLGEDAGLQKRVILFHVEHEVVLLSERDLPNLRVPQPHPRLFVDLVGRRKRTCV